MHAVWMLYFIKRSISFLTKEIFVPLYSSLVWSDLKYTFQANFKSIKMDICHLERTQSAATRREKGLRGLTCDERFKALKLQLFEKRRKENPDPQGTTQTNKPRSNGTFQVLQKARTKNIITWTAVSNRDSFACMMSSTITVRQIHWNRTSVHLRNYLPHAFAHNLALKSTSALSGKIVLWNTDVSTSRAAIGKGFAMSLTLSLHLVHPKFVLYYIKQLLSWVP